MPFSFVLFRCVRVTTLENGDCQRIIAIHMWTIFQERGKKKLIFPSQIWTYSILIIHEGPWKISKSNISVAFLLCGWFSPHNLTNINVTDCFFFLFKALHTWMLCVGVKSGLLFLSLLLFKIVAFLGRTQIIEVSLALLENILKFLTLARAMDVMRWVLSTTKLYFKWKSNLPLGSLYRYTQFLEP